MKTSLLVLFAICSALALSVHAASTQFTYQGRLSDGGAPASGIYDLQFAIYDALTGGNAAGSAVTNVGVNVNNGLFTVALDFGGSVFNGAALWLEMGVRTNGSGDEFTPLSPRQSIRPAPYAIHAVKAATVTGLTLANGRVAIGGASPDRPLTIQGTGANTEWLSFKDTNGLTQWHINQSSNGWNLSESGVADHRLFVQPGGNVGIGASNPGQRLHVQGSALIASNAFVGGNVVVTNNLTVRGALRSGAFTYVFVPGVACVKAYPTDTTTFSANVMGGVEISRGANAGEKLIYLPITLPAVLHGQAATVQSVTIYYRCQNGTNNFISRTTLAKPGDGGNAILNDSTARRSNANDSYTLPANHLGALSSDRGTLGLALTLAFANATERIYIDGARIALSYQ